MKHRGAKRMNIRHGHGPRRGCNAVEKAIETSVRQAGKRLTQREVSGSASCPACGGYDDECICAAE